jgi:hypothetical protein
MENNNQSPKEPTWLTVLKIVYYGMQIMEKVTERLNQKSWDDNVQRYRDRHGRFARG